MELNLRGRTALITGASKGIGRACAEVLAGEGVNVILVSRTAADLEAVRQHIASRCNVNVQVHAYDIADSTNVDPRVAFLASDKSFYTTGTIITIDGGAANRGPMF